MARKEVIERSKEFTRIVRWSSEDDCYIGSIEPVLGDVCHGDIGEHVYAHLVDILYDWIEAMPTLKEAIHG